MLGRNLLIALVPILVQDATYRALLFSLVLLLHALPEVSHMPWMSNVNTFFEGYISLLLVCMAFVGLAFHPTATANAKSTAAAVMTVLFVGVWVSFLAAVIIVFRGQRSSVLSKTRDDRALAGKQFLEKAEGVQDMISADPVLAKRWADTLKSSSDFDMYMFKEVLKFVSDFEVDDVGRRCWSQRNSSKSSKTSSEHTSESSDLNLSTQDTVAAEVPAETAEATVETEV